MPMTEAVCSIGDVAGRGAHSNPSWHRMSICDDPRCLSKRNVNSRNNLNLKFAFKMA